MTGALTVRENLHFSAALRLPSSMSRQQRKARVEKVITQLNLNGCADQKVTSGVHGRREGGSKWLHSEIAAYPQIT